MVNTLSGRFLVLTIIFVMIAEILIFVPSIARFREDYLLDRLERAQIASLAVLAGDGMVDEDLEAELLENAGVLNVVLLRDEVRQLMLSEAGIAPVSHSFDLRNPSAMQLMADAIMRLFRRDDGETIRVIGNPTRDAGLLIEVTMHAAPLREAMIDYGLRILALSAVISIVTAALLFLAVRRLMVLPIMRVVGAMMNYSQAPEDGRRIIDVRANVRELREAETALQAMQTQLTSALKQRERLAKLGEAVAKISHDLRNILNVATLMADRIETSEDPAVRRTTPRLLSSLSRAVSLCESALAFGRAEEPPPRLTHVDLGDLVCDVVENERIAADGADVDYISDVEPGLVARADPEQLYRVLANLIRNARQAIATTGQAGKVTVTASSGEDCWLIRVSDDGPGLPKKAMDHLFQPFQGGTRKGGSGLGLVIAAELVRGHGGTLDLEKSGPEGTVFTIRLPAGAAA
ncbi:sensor histidine kinase [Rhodobacterales bacterium HKCCE3408]|nr:sensor histidine kinase [Rhodobacterales bacterium HKCCE3408]